MTPDDKHRVIRKLGRLWAESAPEVTLGQLVEVIDDVGWELMESRWVATRLMNLPDVAFEQALDEIRNPKQAHPPLGR